MPNEPETLVQRVELAIYDRLIQIGKDRDASILELFEAFKIQHRFKKCEYGESYRGKETQILAIAYYATINNYKYGRKSLP